MERADVLYKWEKRNFFLAHKLFEKYEIPIIGFTENFGKSEDEIRKYLADHKDIENYAIVDDKNLSIDNFVRTDKRFWLTENGTNNVLKLLKKDNNLINFLGSAFNL